MAVKSSSSAMLTPAHSCPQPPPPPHWCLHGVPTPHHMTCTQGHHAPGCSTLAALLSSHPRNLVLYYIADVQSSLAICMLNHSSRLLTSHSGQHPFLCPHQGSSGDTPQNDAGLGHPPHAWLFGSLSFALISHAFTALQLFLGCSFPNDLGGMEACASLPFTVLQTNIVGLYLYDHSCQGGARCGHPQYSVVIPFHIFSKFLLCVSTNK